MANMVAEEEKATIPEAVALEIYRNIYATRRFELRCIELYRQGRIRGYLHPYLGEEAVAAGACAALRPQDYIVSTHRGHGHCISKGADLRLMMAEITGKATGYCRGRGGSMHISSKQLNHLGANGIVGGGIPIAAGAAMGIKVRQGDQVVVAFFSDGASNNGVFAESLNMAGIYRLPVIFMLENNHYAVSTPIECATGCCDLAGRGPAYGVPGICVDGNDAVAVYRATLRAAERARRGEGPSLIEANTFRHGGHHVNDPGLYMDPKLLQEWKARDPVAIMQRIVADPVKIQAIEGRVEAELEAAVDFAAESPEPDVAAFLAEIPD
ncbi:MAG: thiamine pyrophosphate-dependent dehydrogenase E1 component subunit alpha [Desulfobacterales bacterium]|jgi:TPP-dependent pyruvate/acetoin dehydrogenase alpha subunit|nr:thiamine pyrophosphate-dependent dehydrogenase E1 component subunit alpha [Desulfobacterales bacterium]